MTQMEAEREEVDLRSTLGNVLGSGNMILDKGSHGGNSVWLFPCTGPKEEDRGEPEGTQTEAQRAEEVERSLPGVSEALLQVDAEKSSGNIAFKKAEYESAVGHYQKGLVLVLQAPLAGKVLGNRLTVTLQCNLAATHLKQGMFSAAVGECARALQVDKSCVKALFRQAEAYRELGNYSKAVKNLDQARSLEPNNLAIAYALEDTLEELEEAGGGCCTEGPGEETHLSKGSEEVPAELRQEEEAFARECMAVVSTEFARTGEAAATVWMRHVDASSASEATGGPAHKLGKIVVEGAFRAADTLRSAVEFVRSQHTTAHASAAIVTVRKRTMLYPLAWWAGEWPLSIEVDGVFAELHSAAHRTTRTWFMALEEENQILLEPVELKEDCGLLVDMPSIFL
eukprot:CAMPEP_0196573002 /NCGR_PEP_ID=MMETSP1081-20130531/2972_1 /TAXON_ID=36882 /ORGANISM="Pyramimonas amylifera, Strain CCMP720" /LENGTH=397 /DNA_ID=CAMNT_0041890549 /DNA_START=181 /DNA_END=1374 /DNA_ORIENTATION=+